MAHRKCYWIRITVVLRVICGGGASLPSLRFRNTCKSERGYAADGKYWLRHLTGMLQCEITQHEGTVENELLTQRAEARLQFRSTFCFVWKAEARRSYLPVQASHADRTQHLCLKNRQAMRAVVIKARCRLDAVFTLAPRPLFV